MSKLVYKSEPDRNKKDKYRHDKCDISPMSKDISLPPGVSSDNVEEYACPYRNCDKVAVRQSDDEPVPKCPEHDIDMKLVEP